MEQDGIAGDLQCNLGRLITEFGPVDTQYACVPEDLI